MPIDGTAARRRRLTFRSFLPRKFDGYILGDVIGPFLGGVVFFLFLFLMFRTLVLAEMLIVHGASAATLARMTGLMALQFLPMVLPVAFLIAVLVGFGRLSADSELVAMKASGVSIWRMSVPVLAFSLVVVSFSLGLNMEWSPWSESASKNLLIRLSNTKVASSIKEGTFTSGFFDLLIYAEKVDSRNNRMKRVFIYDERNPKTPFTVVARTGEILPVKTASEFGSAAMLKLYNGSIHRNDASGNIYQKIDFETYRLYLKIDEGAPNASWKPAMIPYKDLRRIIRETSPETKQGRQMRGEFWRRYAIALSPLIFVFLGIGFGTARTRAVRAGAALVAFLTLLVYWTILSAATIAVNRGTLPPFLAMQLPNLTVLVAAIASFKGARW
ncbi:MAG: LptF/LptG family permease [Oligoflexia bacterium]|nr:LptF/LptG family permease [Oligoflexia bacterium]